MKYEDKELGVSFTIPDRITVGSFLEYHSLKDFSEPEERWLKAWEASKAVVEDWQCPLLPEMDKLNLSSNDARLVKIVRWTAGEAAEHIARLMTIPKV